MKNITMQEDEQQLLIAVYKKATAETVHDVHGRLNIPFRRYIYLLEKWRRKGWYDADDLEFGQLTDAGKQVAQYHVELLESPEQELGNLLGQLVQKALTWKFVNAIVVWIAPASPQGGVATANVRLVAHNGSKYFRTFTADQVRSTGIEALISEFRHTIRDSFRWERYHETV